MKKILLSALFALAMVGGPSAKAGPLVVDGGWTGFTFGGVGSPASENTMTFTAVTDVLLKITDAFLFGDIFSVVIDGAPAVLTSIPGSGTETSDPDAAFDVEPYSKFSIVLAAGAHTVDIFADTSPFGSGGAFVEVETARVPVPATLALLGLGLLGLGWSRRKN